MEKRRLAPSAGNTEEARDCDRCQNRGCRFGNNKLQEATNLSAAEFARMDIPIRAAARQGGGKCDFGGRIGSAIGRDVGWIPTRRLSQIQDAMKCAGENAKWEAGERRCRGGDAGSSLKR